MALRAGVPVADVEFMQFHPTALHHPAMPRPLLSEALRGHGALLRDAEGERFVDELSPRDVVSQAMTARMLEQGVDHLWLDATGLERFDERFPTIAASLRGRRPRPGPRLAARSPRPPTTSPAAWSPTSTAPPPCPACGPCGEVACTGVHGANRLASNSLLEGMVWAPRVVEAIERGKDGPDPTGAMRPLLLERPVPGVIWATAQRRPARRGRRRPASPAADRPATRPTAEPTPAKLRDRLQRAMTAGAGVLRSADVAGRHRTPSWPSWPPRPAPTAAPWCELRNLLWCGPGPAGRGHRPGGEPGRPRPHRLPRDQRRLCPPVRAQGHAVTWIDPPVAAVRDVVGPGPGRGPRRARRPDRRAWSPTTPGRPPISWPASRACWPAGCACSRRSRPSTPASAVEWPVARRRRGRTPAR